MLLENPQGWTGDAVPSLCTLCRFRSKGAVESLSLEQA